MQPDRGPTSGFALELTTTLTHVRFLRSYVFCLLRNLRVAQANRIDSEELK